MKLFQQIPQLATLAAISFALVACGGGDNNSNSSSSSSSQLSSAQPSSMPASSVQPSSIPASSAQPSSVQASSSLQSSSASSITLPPLVLNEMRSDGGGYDYIEIYNAGNTDYTFTAGEWAVNDLKGFNDDKVPGVVIPAGKIISAKGFLLVAVDQTAVPFGAPENTVIGGGR